VNPFVSALLFLLHERQNSGNHPDGSAQRHIDAIEQALAFNELSEDRPPQPPQPEDPAPAAAETEPQPPTATDPGHAEPEPAKEPAV
jgi:hypothetical protein